MKLPILTREQAERAIELLEAEGYVVRCFYTARDGRDGYRIRVSATPLPYARAAQILREAAGPIGHPGDGRPRSRVPDASPHA